MLSKTAKIFSIGTSNVSYLPCAYTVASANYQMLELAFTRATSASWLLKQPDKQELSSPEISAKGARVLASSTLATPRRFPSRVSGSHRLMRELAEWFGFELPKLVV